MQINKSEVSFGTKLIFNEKRLKGNHQSGMISDSGMKTIEVLKEKYAKDGHDDIDIYLQFGGFMHLPDTLVCKAVRTSDNKTIKFKRGFFFISNGEAPLRVLYNGLKYHCDGLIEKLSQNR